MNEQLYVIQCTDEESAMEYVTTLFQLLVNHGCPVCLLLPSSRIRHLLEKEIEGDERCEMSLSQVDFFMYEHRVNKLLGEGKTVLAVNYYSLHDSLRARHRSPPAAHVFYLDLDGDEIRQNRFQRFMSRESITHSTVLHVTGLIPEEMFVRIQEKTVSPMEIDITLEKIAEDIYNEPDIYKDKKWLKFLAKKYPNVPSPMLRKLTTETATI